jgi:hypothetical protein
MNGSNVLCLWSAAEEADASLATQVKIIAGVLTELLMGVLAAIWLVRWNVLRRV